MSSQAKRQYRSRIKDVNAPRRPTTAFNFFMKMNSAEYIEKNKNIQLNEVIKIMSIDWHQLTNDDRQPYNEAAAVAREQYEVELQKYHNTPEYQEYLQLRSDVQNGRVDASTIKKAKHRKESAGAPSNHPIKAKIPQLKKKFKVDFEVFSDTFKDFNRRREDALKQLRKVINGMEEEIEDCEERIEKLQQEKLKMASEKQEHLHISRKSSEYLGRWKRVLISSMSERQLEQYGLRKDSSVDDIVKALTDAQKHASTSASLKKHISSLKFN